MAPHAARPRRSGAALLPFLLSAGAAWGQPGPDATLAGMADTGTCSGVVARFKTQSLSSPALVVTNGHCVRRMGSDEVLVHAPSGRTLTLFDASGRPVRREFRPREILYATMAGVDIALYQLRETFAELETSWGVPSRVLADRGVEAGPQPVLMPSGRARRTLWCRLEGSADVREGAWSWRDALRLEGCRVEHGMSGSPLLSNASGEIVGVVNTFHAGTGAPCAEDNPCEVDSAGRAAIHPGRSYGSRTGVLNPCRGPAGGFSLDGPGCGLPRPAGLADPPS